MQDEREKVTELLKSGKYYEEAMKWYNSRYIMPKTQLACMVFFATIAASFFFISFASTISLFPLSKIETFEINRHLDANEMMIVKQLGEDKDDANVLYLEYMLKEYVKSREEYNPKRVDRNFNYVIELSSDAIFMDYLTIADKNQNPSHPVWEYGAQAVKEIFITKTSFVNLDPKSPQFNSEQEYQANINFIASVLFVDDLQTKGNLQANLTFKFTPVVIDQDTNEIKQLPKLVITDYKTKKL